MNWLRKLLTRMKLSNIRSIDSGTNALVLKATFDEKDVIIKQYGFERKINSKAPRINKNTFEDLYTDSLALRQKVQKNNVKKRRRFRITQRRISSAVFEQY